MSEEQTPGFANEDEENEIELSYVDPYNEEEEEEEYDDEAMSDDSAYEEISSDEVDRVISSLEDIAESIDSENIRGHIEDAINAIFYLVYDESDEQGLEDEGLSAAA